MVEGVGPSAVAGRLKARRSPRGSAPGAGSEKKGHDLRVTIAQCDVDGGQVSHSSVDVGSGVDEEASALRISTDRGVDERGPTLAVMRFEKDRRNHTWAASGRGASAEFQ